MSEKTTGNPLYDEWVNRMENLTAPAATTITPTAYDVKSAETAPVATISNPVADWIAGGNIVFYHANFAHLTMSATAGVLFSQMWKWGNTPTARERDGWFWLTQEQITEQTGLFRSEQETARRRLRALELIEEDKRGIPMKVWYRVGKERFFVLAEEYLADKGAFRKKYNRFQPQRDDSIEDSKED